MQSAFADRSQHRDRTGTWRVQQRLRRQLSAGAASAKGGPRLLARRQPSAGAAGAIGGPRLLARCGALLTHGAAARAQVCLLDLDYNLPVQARDSALGVEDAALPESDAGKEYALAKMQADGTLSADSSFAKACAPRRPRRSSADGVDRAALPGAWLAFGGEGRTPLGQCSGACRRASPCGVICAARVSSSASSTVHA